MVDIANYRFDDPGKAFDAGYNRVNALRQDQARYSAGNALRGGDYGAAAGAYYDAGMNDEGLGVTKFAGQQQDRQKAAEQAELVRRAEGLMRVGLTLQGVPLEQRPQVYQQISPALRQLGLSPEAIAAGGRDFSDATLATYLGELDKHLQGVNLGGGGYGVFNTRTGDFKTVREPTQKAPVGYRFGADGNLEIDPGYVAGQAQVSDVRAAATAAHRPPRRGRSGGRGGSQLPPGFILD